MNFVDLINTVNAVVELVRNVSELPHMDKMPDMVFFFGVSLNNNKATKDKGKQN
ncbi:hypothetical protein ABEX44_25655 [Priestia megaterium]